MKNYRLIEEKFLKDIDSNVYIYEHLNTKARIVYIKNDDKNKVFSIAFRTPAKDSTGLTHILEHSVLCGSSKYPVKDPFVELLKSSLNTFLNAFTFPDKTMYPCASMNDKDFKNIMDVYLDSVFFPNIYNYKEIFMQEGWHYKLENIEDDIEYTGVVYNEMKGAFSDPDQVLGREVLHSLFPDNSYSFESGGNPENIPELSYEDFINFHKKYYHPSNSYIFLYGALDIEERLDYLDKEYLSKFSYDDFNTVIEEQKPFESPKESKLYYPISSDEDLNDKTYLSYNVAIKNELCNKDILALSTVFGILFNEPGAIIKQAIIDKKLGTDVECSFETGIKYPLLSIVIKGSNESSLQELIKTVDEELKKVIEVGVNKEELLAFLDYQEFKIREAKYGMPKGIIVAMTMLDTWLYNENDKYSRLESLDCFNDLKEACKTSYFEDLLKEQVLDNNHKTYVTLLPSYTCQNESQKHLVQKLQEYKNSLNKEELESLVKVNEELKKYQETPSSKEDVDKLPKLELADIEKEPEKLNLEVLDKNYKVLFANYKTNDINYLNLYFDVTKLDYKLVPYTKLLCHILTLVSTAEYGYKEIGKLINAYTGGLNTSFVISQTYNSTTKSTIVLSTSFLTNRKDDALNLLNSILFSTKFDDTKRIYELLCMAKNNLESFISYRGNGVALTRAGAKINEVSFLNDSIAGIGYLDFLSDLIKNYESKKEDLVSTLKRLYKNLFYKGNFSLGYTGENDGLNKVLSNVDKIYNSLNDKTNLDFNAKFIPNKYNEGIKTQYNVNYVARFGTFNDLSKYNGSFLALSNAINMDYLWMKVRVLGGAYGCQSIVSPLGFIGFTSYRDPNIEKTDVIYKNVIDFISNLNPNDEELFKYKIGGIASLSLPSHVSDRGNRAQLNHLIGLTYEYRLSRYQELLNTTVSEFSKDKVIFIEALNNSSLCVIGNDNNIEKSKSIFDKIRSLK